MPSESILSIREKVPIQMTVHIQLVGPMDNNMFGYVRANTANMKQFFENWLKESDVAEFEWTKTAEVPRVSYEHKFYLLEARVLLEGADDLCFEGRLLTNFIMKFSMKARGMLHDQVFLKVNQIHSHFSEITPEHAMVAVSHFAVGNCINPGLFFVRGDYFTQLNQPCCQKLKPHFYDDHNVYHVAGMNQYLSFAWFKHDERMFHVYFGIRLLKPSVEKLDYAGFRMDLEYTNFLRICVDLTENDSASIYIQLKTQPLLWECLPRDVIQQGSKMLNMETCNDWVRVLSWPGDAEKQGVGCTVHAFSQSNWIKVSLPKSEIDNLSVNKYAIEIAVRLSRRSDAKLMFGPIVSVRRKLAPSPALHSLGTFRADYTFQALITRGSVFMDQLFNVDDDKIPKEAGVPMKKEHEPRFLKLVRQCMLECTLAAEEALEHLLNAFDKHRNIHIVDAFNSLYLGRKRHYERLLRGDSRHDVGHTESLPKNCVKVAKVVLTPSKAILMAPEMTMTNRVLRKFGPENALRCVFRDDNLKSIRARDFSVDNAFHRSSIHTEMIYDTLRNGIDIGSRHYSFLGWSNSQLREPACYMFAPKVDPTTGHVTGTVEEIRAWMGDFSQITSLPKLMSRMGQCFTQAQPTVRLKRKHWIVEEDITGGVDNQYCFSDGCGRISYKVARQMSQLLDLPKVPSCFQIRFKGFKGILVIDPMIDEIVDEPKVIFRKSQQKFGESAQDSEDYLEVVKYSMPTLVSLNRPFITILDQVSEKQSSRSHQMLTNRVHYYLERELFLLSNMLIDDKQAAVELTCRTSVPINWIHASNQAGFQLCVDPFVRAMILSIYRHSIVSHISKAQIFLPPNMGRTMYGVVDETGLLQYGQVFVQYSPKINEPNTAAIIKTGKVLVSKNPCRSPGDVRVFDAVHQPALSHLVDVIAFPQHGPRPPPDEMAGSDLDGDEYIVIWDQELLFDRNEPATIYPNTKKNGKEKVEPTDEDMIEFFLEYTQQDQLARLSTVHLIISDQFGLFNENCQSIANKCAIALDYSKTGICADNLRKGERYRTVPDYVKNSSFPVYNSNRLNGQLFRKANKIVEILEANKSADIFEGDFDKLICPDDFDVFFGNETKLLATLTIHDEYANQIQLLLDEYGIEDEASLLSGHSTSIERMSKMERDNYTFYHTDKIVELRYGKLFAAFRGKFFEEFGGEDACTVTEHDGTKKIAVTTAMREKARQWYYVAYVQPKKNRISKVIGQSLPWVAWEALCDMRKHLMTEKPEALIRVKYPVSGRLEQEILKAIDNQSERFAEFEQAIANTRHGKYLTRYSKVYGPQLVQLLFVIKVWLEHENLLPSPCLTIWHIGRLLVRLALGAMRTNPTIDYERTVLGAPEKVFEKWLTKEPEPDEEPILTSFDMGALLIEFLRHLASQSFAQARNMELRVFSDTNIVEPVLLRPFQWIPLHNLAYRAFHTMAVSGRFGALFLSSDDELVDLVSESTDPILVEDSWFIIKTKPGYRHIGRPELYKALKRWSGCKEMNVRELPCRFRAEAQMNKLTLVGTALAKQRFARLLMLSQETIRDAIINDVMPQEACDEFL